MSGDDIACAAVVWVVGSFLLGVVIGKWIAGPPAETESENDVGS